MTIRHAYLDEHGGGGCNGLTVYAPDADWRAAYRRQHKLDERKSDQPFTLSDLHVEIHGMTRDEFYKEADSEGDE